MKKIILFSLLIAIGVFANAQRFVYVDTDYILSKVPEYEQAQTKLDKQAQAWRSEIETKYAAIDKAYKNYQAEEALLTEAMRQQKEDGIIAQEKEVKDFQKSKFGYEGELFQMRKELVKPLQDKIFSEIEKMATAKSYDFVLDKANGSGIMFSNPKYDKSEEILKKLGVASK